MGVQSTLWDAGSPLSVPDLAGVIYSSGKVFDGLSTGRLQTEAFLRSGSLEGIESRSDLFLLQDLRDAAEFVLASGNRTVSPGLIKDVNARLTRSASINPGEYRSAASRIGVRTRYGRHGPPAVTDALMLAIVNSALAQGDRVDQALDLFVRLAKAQPFSDGNKRTALFVANHHLIYGGTGFLLTIPVEEDDPEVADRFNDLLARAYIFDEHEEVKVMLREQGLVQIGSGGGHS